MFYMTEDKKESRKTLILELDQLTDKLNQDLQTNAPEDYKAEKPMSYSEAAEKEHMELKRKLHLYRNLDAGYE